MSSGLNPTALYHNTGVRQVLLHVGIRQPRVQQGRLGVCEGGSVVIVVQVHVTVVQVHVTVVQV